MVGTHGGSERTPWLDSQAAAKPLEAVAQASRLRAVCRSPARNRDGCATGWITRPQPGRLRHWLAGAGTFRSGAGGTSTAPDREILAAHKETPP